MTIFSLEIFPQLKDLLRSVSLIYFPNLREWTGKKGEMTK